MMYEEIDCRGLNCPQPVINIKKALGKIAEGTITAIVDNESARENLIKFAKGMNLSSEVSEPQHGEYHISIHKGQELNLGFAKGLEDTKGTYTILVTANTLGRGSEELGSVLIKSFFYTLTEQDSLPLAIIFLNGGVLLTCENSPVLEHVLHLESVGTEILSCGTCLDYYSLKDKLCVGTVSNMYTIMERLQRAEKLITL